MALLAEEIVEAWLNRNGFFTIRGIKLGVHEIDLLALRVTGTQIEARHIEVQASVRPISYLCQLPKAVQQATGRKPQSTKLHSRKEMTEGVKEWVNKKYFVETKRRIRNKLYSGEWGYELVVHHVRYPEELELIEKHGIKVHRLDDVIAEMSQGKTPIQSASGSELLELVILGRQ